MANDKNTSESKRDAGAAPGGWTEPFPTTHWTEISDVRSGNGPRREAALAELLARYWKPVYFYLRRRGHDLEAAKDLTQGFFREIVLGRSLVQQADRAKGRFQTFLLTALDRYATTIRRAEGAKRRMPEGGLVRLDGIETLNLPEAVRDAAPHEAFDYAWAAALLDRVIAEVAAEFREVGKANHWDVFRERVLQPIVDNSGSPSLSFLCEKYNIRDEAKASKMIIAAKRRFQAVLRRRVRQFVDSDSDIDDEIRHLIRVFCRSGGR